jgi:hypothetical protein
LGTTGLRATYTLPGPPTTPDALTIIQDLKVNGSNFSNSTVEVSTTIINNGTLATSVGVRYLWDMQVALDDGPTFQQVGPSAPLRTTETEYLSPAFTAFKIEDNDVNTNVPTFDVFGTVNGPSTIVPTPTRPTKLQYASWAGSVGTAFDYTINPALVIAVSGATTLNDSAVLYYFGNSASNALAVAAGGSVKVSASMFLTPPGFVLGGIEQLACTTPIPDPQPTQLGCVTRPARWWMTHPVGDTDNCATLLKALQTNGGGVDLGFICLPTTFRTADNVADAQDAVIEALGLYFGSKSVTGEENGTQSQRLPGSRLCTARKRLAGEMIAATANVVLFGTDPGNCQFRDSGGLQSFPTNLLKLAGAAASGGDPVAIRAMTVELRRFNALGQTNDLSGGLLECSTTKPRTLRSAGRDPTTATTCPGLNDSCDAAEFIVSLPFKRSVNLTQYTDTFPSPSCGAGGAEAIWKVVPPVAAPGRTFVINTKGSNFGTLVSVWRGTSCATAVEAGCSTQTDGSTPSNQLQFTSDGTNTYFIVVEGVSGAAGALKLNVSSF